jgi:hypothetical protein
MSQLLESWIVNNLISPFASREDAKPQQFCQSVANIWLRTSVILIVSGAQLIVKGGSPSLIKYWFLPYT